MAESIKEHTVPDWDKFIKILDTVNKYSSIESPPFLFRGQARTDWNLVPSLIRRNQIQGELNAADIFAVEKYALDEFQKEAHLYLPKSVVPEIEDTVNWWMHMQHHGTSTRLMDWTNSPYVALYFAVVQEYDKSGVIWMVHWAELNIFMKEKYPTVKLEYNKANSLVFDPNAPPVLFLLSPIFQTDRMIAQQTMLSFSPQVLASYESILTDFISENNKGQVTKIIIPAELKMEFLERLRAMNISARTLFPGIDGLGKGIFESVNLVWKEKKIRGRLVAENSQSSNERRK